MMASSMKIINESKKRVKRQYNPDKPIADLYVAIRKHNSRYNNKLNEIENDLLPHIEDINDVDYNDMENSPLHVAVNRGHVDVADLLLNKSDIDINKPNREGNTALHLAVLNQNEEMVKLLLNHNANILIANKMEPSKTPLDISQNYETPIGRRINELLQSHIGDMIPSSALSENELAMKKLKLFVTKFTLIFLMYFTVYNDRLEHKTPKSGKWLDLLNRLVGVASGGNEAFDNPKHKALSILTINIITTMAEWIGATLNRKSLKNLNKQLIFFDEEPDEVIKILVRSGIEVYVSFKEQLLPTTVDGLYEIAVFKEAEDAVGRAINYFRDKKDKDFCVETVTEGIVLGESKRFKTAAGLPNVLHKGHTVINKHGQALNTGDIYLKTGLRIDGKFYVRFKDTKDFGYRPPLKFDNIHYYQEKTLDDVDEYYYESVLNLDEDEKNQLETELCNLIKNGDPTRSEQRIKDMLQESREEINTEIDQQFKEIEEFLTENFAKITVYLDGMQQLIEQGNEKVLEKINESDKKMLNFLEEFQRNVEKQISEVGNDVKEVKSQLKRMDEAGPSGINLQSPSKQFNLLLNFKNLGSRTNQQVSDSEDEGKLEVVRSEEHGYYTINMCLEQDFNTNREKREINECELTWDDVDAFTDESEKIRDINQIEINSNKFVNFIRSNKISKRKFFQLMDLARRVKFNDNYRNIVERINNNKKVMDHLNKVGSVSGLTMHTMIAKNALADFLNGDYKGVAINIGFIAGGYGFVSVAQAASLKGVNMVAERKVFLGRSLQAASPFLARGTSAFVVYDLVNQIKDYRKGTKEALVGIIGDGIYLTVDAAEIGVEIAEGFSLLEGVSSITGPIGAAVGAVVFVSTDVYMAIKRVDYLNKEIHLTGGERFFEGLRAFIGLHPGRHIEELLKEKQLNNQLVAHGLEYMKQNGNIKNYIFPLGKMVDDPCQSVPQSKRICVSAGFTGCVRTRTVTKYVQKCSHKFLPDPDNTVILDKKINGIRWSRANPDVPAGSGLLCFTAGEESIMPVQETYFCEYSMGITVFSTNKSSNYTLINLGDGKDYAKGFVDNPNIFVVGEGFKTYYGGNNNDTFILIGNSTSGNLHGEGGTNTLDLTTFAVEDSWIESRFDMAEIIIPSQDNHIKVTNINMFLGRKFRADRLNLNCDMRNNITYIDGQAGGRNLEDYINILNGNCIYNTNIVLRANTYCKIEGSHGNFNFIIPISIGGSSTVKFFPTSAPVNVNSTFLFQYDITEINSITRRFNKRLQTINFNLKGNFNITISGVESAAYRFSDGEVKMGVKGDPYLLGKSNQTVEEIIPAYLELGNRLGNVSCFVRAVNFNETVAISSGNHQVLFNDPMHKSHLINNGGENVFVITAHENVSFTLPDVIIYNFNKRKTVNTIDIRNVVVNKNADAFIIEQDNKDLLLSVLQPMNFIVKLKDGIEWYNQTQIIFSNSPLTIVFENNAWNFAPLPLRFGKDKEIICIKEDDVEANTEIITPRGKTKISFVRDNNNLLLTNIFERDVPYEDTLTIIFRDYYESSNNKMKTLRLKTSSQEIFLNDYAYEISNAKTVHLNIENYNVEFYEEFMNNINDDQIRRTKRMASSSSDRHSSIINNVINWIKTASTSFISNVSDVFNLSNAFDKNINSFNNINMSGLHFNATIMLLDIILAKKQNRKLYSVTLNSANNNIQPFQNLILWNIFEDAVNKTAKFIGIPENDLNIDYFDMREMVKIIEKEIKRGEFDSINSIMEIYARKVYSGVNVDKFIIYFNIFLNQCLTLMNEQHHGNFTQFSTDFMNTNSF